MNERDEISQRDTAVPDGRSEVSPFSRRRFLQKAATLAIGGSLTVSWLAACASQPTATPVIEPTATTTAPTPTYAPATTAPTAVPTTVAATSTPIATATSVPPTATIAPPTATATIAPPKSLKFAVFGDLRTDGLFPPPIFNKLLGMSKERKPEAALLMGDIINSDTDSKVIAKQYANVKAALKPLGDVPVLPTIGNHETNGRKSALPAYVEAWPDLPKNGPKDLTTLVYSADIGPVHFVSLASELPGQFGRLGQTQFEWLENDLANNRQPYTIVMAHDPAYPAGPYLGVALDSIPKERDQFWSILTKYKVSAYLAGHEHLYNRKERNGVTQLIIGVAGSSPYGGYGGDFYHYGFFETTPNGLLVHIYDESGKERDQVTLKPGQ